MGLLRIACPSARLGNRNWLHCFGKKANLSHATAVVVVVVIDVVAANQYCNVSINWTPVSEGTGKRN